MTKFERFMNGDPNLVLDFKPITDREDAEEMEKHLIEIVPINFDAFVSAIIDAKGFDTFIEYEEDEDEEDYGIEKDAKVESICCPECGEPIYREDWENFYVNKNGSPMCPICETFLE